MAPVSTAGPLDVGFVVTGGLIDAFKGERWEEDGGERSGQVDEDDEPSGEGTDGRRGSEGGGDDGADWDE